MKSRIITIVFLLCFLCACVGNNNTSVQIVATEIPLVSTATLAPISAATVAPTATVAPASNFSDTLTPKQYLDVALDYMQNSSINRSHIDWVTLRAKAHERANGAKTYADTYEAIRFALQSLGDHHSSLLTPDTASRVKKAAVTDYRFPTGKIVEEKIGYIDLPTFLSFDRDQQQIFATNVQQVIRDLDANQPCGWVVDLRENLGGHFFAMLAGIGPILGEGRAGEFIEPENIGKQKLEYSWFYINGRAYLEFYINGALHTGKDQQVEVKDSAYKLKGSAQPVAILTGTNTASAAEAVVIAFQGRPNTRRFGNVTRGAPSYNRAIFMPDYALIFLTTMLDADRAGKIYDGPIAPDEVIADKGETLKAAAKWLLNQPACIGNK